VAEPIWLRRDVLLAVHGQLLADHGGAQGVRDEGLLDSALARPKQLFSYGDPDIGGLAAAYAFAIAKTHPFVDGNKRAAFMAAYVFLVRNGYRPSMSEAEAVVMMSGVASGEISEDELAVWFANNVQPQT
jgi:death-on-curing protein